MRLIDADALEKDMRAYADNKAYCGHIELANGILKAVGRIDEAPTVAVLQDTASDCDNCQWRPGCMHHRTTVRRINCPLWRPA